MKETNQTDEKYTWNLTPLFTGDNDPRIAEVRQEVKLATTAFVNKWEKRTDYLEDPAILKEALDEYEIWNRQHGPYIAEDYYYYLRLDQNQLDSDLRAHANKIDELGKKLQNEIQFFELRLAKVSPEYQQIFLSSPLLTDYHHFLETLFQQAKHQLSEAEEKIVTLKYATSHQYWVDMTSRLIAKEEREAIDENGQKITKPLTELLSLLYSQNKKVRDTAATAINDILTRVVPVAESEMNAILANKNNIEDELRHYGRPDSARHLADDIDTSTVDTLIKTVSDNLSISHRWYELKAELLGLTKLEYHERMIEYGQTGGKQYSYEEATSLVSQVYSNLDPELGQIFDSFVTNRQIDVYPRKGKKGGAFCASVSPAFPIYVLLNHTGKLNDVCTIAHELGHGLNDVFMKQAQNAINYGSPLSTAEVASTFFEDFALRKLMQEADDELKLALMVQKLDEDVATIFRQAACYMFEQELHAEFRAKGYLSQEEIGAIFQKHMADYLGPSVNMSEGSQNWWVYWSHIRRFFYVYSYVSGLLISKSLQNSVKQNPEFIVKVKEFLGAGSSRSPKDIFAGMGIDITDAAFWEKGLAEVESLLSETEALARKLGKI